MPFSNPVFLFAFLPAVLLLYFSLWRGLRNLVLLIASLGFYAWGEQMIVLVMVLSIGANWGFGLWVARARGRTSARVAIALSVAFNLGLLVLFKYANWIWAVLSSLLQGLGFPEGTLPDLAPIPLPIGISFFTFQAISYVIDVYRNEGEVQRNPLNFAVYISLFPQLIAGPIVRYRDIARQIRQRQENWSLFCSGVMRFTIGLGKKILIANVVARPADQIFAIPTDQLPLSVAWLGVICYAAQIYFDFSGYSDMAIGLGRMFGFQFLENFNYPYISRSITEFWRRWHISLSSWFRDYLYIPLGGNRRGRTRTLIHLLLVFLLCGLWHGAAWNFIAWGLFHGCFLVFERLGREQGKRFPALVKHCYTLLVIAIGWVLFRAPGLSEAVAYVGALFGLAGSGGPAFHLGLYLSPSVELTLLAGLLGSMPWLPNLNHWLDERRQDRRMQWAVRGLETVGMISIFLVLLLSVMHMSAGTYDPFIYFRF